VTSKRERSVTGTPDPNEPPAPWETSAGQLAASEDNEDQAAVPDAATAGTDAGDGTYVLGEEYVPEVDPRYQTTMDRLRRSGVGQPVKPSQAMVLGPVLQGLVGMLREEARAADNGAAAVFEDIVTRVMAADNADDVLASDDAVDAEDILNVPLQLWGINVQESDFTDGLPCYVAMRVRRGDTNEDCVVTCGSVKVVAKAFKLHRIKAFPVQVKVVQSKNKTSSGYYVLDLVKA